jgi:hypothetical protein
MFKAFNRHEYIIMKIGIDFDNTIVNYTGVFFDVAVQFDLIPSNIDRSKSTVRNYLRDNNLEQEWTKLQGNIYGSKMELAKPYEGVIEFIKICQENNIEIFIISHKSKHPYLGPKYNLHKAAKDWLEQNTVLKKISPYFEITLERKLKKIEALNCDYFIDDLPELLTESDFPKKVKKILFDSQNIYNDSINYQRFVTWYEIKDFFKNKF